MNISHVQKLGTALFQGITHLLLDKTPALLALCSFFSLVAGMNSEATDRKCGLREGAVTCNTLISSQAELEPVTLWFCATILRTSLSDQHVLACGPQYVDPD